MPYTLTSHPQFWIRSQRVTEISFYRDRQVLANFKGGILGTNASSPVNYNVSRVASIVLPAAPRPAGPAHQLEGGHYYLRDPSPKNGTEVHLFLDASLFPMFNLVGESEQRTERDTLFVRRWRFSFTNQYRPATITLVEVVSREPNCYGRALEEIERYVSQSPNHGYDSAVLADITRNAELTNLLYEAAAMYRLVTGGKDV